MFSAFLLTSQWADDNTLTFWWHSAKGTLQQRLKQPSVCFIEQRYQTQLEQILTLLNWPVTIKEVALQHFNGAQVCACYVQNNYRKRWARLLAEQNISCYEADIRPPQRYLMERFIYGQASLSGQISPVDHVYAQYSGRLYAAQEPAWQPQLKALAVDIETSMPRTDAPDRLFSISLYAADYQLVLMLGEGPAQAGVEYYADEASLLRAWLVKLNHYDPDVIIGWNIIQFDWRFLIKKFKQYKLPFQLGRDGSALSYYEQQDSGTLYVNIAGRLLLDGISLLKNAAYQFESFALNAVAKHFLAEEKLLTGEQRGSDIEALFKHDKLRLAAYNLKDSELVWRIFAQAQLLDFAIERSRLTGLALDRVGGSVAAFENLYLPHLHRAGFIAPNEHEGQHFDSPGGYVLDSTPGLFDHVLVLDFKSLYPSIMRTFCIDPVARVVADQAPAEQRVAGFCGAYFDRRKAILPAILARLGQQREEAKKQGNQALSKAIKIIMASCYGVLGAQGSRLSDSRLTASITLRGQELIQRSAKWIRQQGYEVIYGDTDSLFVWLKQLDAGVSAQQSGQSLAAGLNQYWQQQIQQQYRLVSYLEVEFETYYQRFFMPYVRGAEVGSKKRYVGLADRQGQPQLVFKGLEAVRSDWTELAREFQQQLYHKVFFNQPYTQWLQAQVKALLAGEMDHALVYRKRLGQPLSAYQTHIPPHAQAAMKLEQWRVRQHLTPLFEHSGGRIEYVQTLNGPEPLWPDGSSNGALDYAHYLDKQIRPLAEALFHFTGDDFEQLVGQQLSLF